MNELILDLNVLIVAMAGLTAFVIYIASTTKTSKFLKNRISDRDVEIKDWKHKFNVMKGKYSKMSNTELIDPSQVKQIKAGDVKLSDAIPTILNSAAEHLPKGLKELAKSNKIQGMLQGLAEKYPNEASQFLSGMLPRITAAASEGTQEEGSL